MNMADSSNKEFYIDDFLGELQDFGLLKPKISQEMAIDFAKRLYGLEVSEIKEMGSFADQNFHINVSNKHQNPYIEQISDEGYTLKIINPIKSSMEGHFDSMHTAMEYLNKKELRVPVPVQNLEGKRWQLENVPTLKEDDKSPEGKKCGIHLLTYISGVPAGTIENVTENFFQWGFLLAKFHTVLKDLESPSLRRKDLVSSVKYFSAIGNFLECLDEEKQMRVHEVLDRFSSEVAGHIESVPKGFVHGDFNEHNILAEVRNTDIGDKIYSINGVLDFEDMHYGPYVWDIGIMLAHVSIQETNMDPLEAVGHAIAGYHSLRPLEKSEMSMLKVCMECRLYQSLVICIHFAAMDPSSSYISGLSSSSEPKLKCLFLLSTTKDEQLLQKWNDILNQYS